MMKNKYFLFLVLGVNFLCCSAVFAQEKAQILPLNEFIDLAVKKDTEFEKILIDQLSLQYEKDLNLPADDLILEVKAQYDFFLNQNREDPEGSVSLSKLFPFAGTMLEAEYKTTPSFTSLDNTSEVTFSIVQPIAQNAFGKATRLKDKIVGIEIDVARYQIIEAYEDYLATIIIGYYDWAEAYENLLIGTSSYEQNTKLLDNIKDRQKSNIALPLDVNKVHLQVLAKKEKLVELKEAYARALNFIEQAIRFDGLSVLQPQESLLYADVVVDFKKDYPLFLEKSRTFEVLRFLEEKSQLQVDEEADDLLPSIDLLFAYNVKGKKFQLTNEDNMVYAGVSMSWPLGNQLDRAEFEMQKIDLAKTKLLNTGIHFQLYTDVKDLALQMQREQDLVLIAQEKIDLASSIVTDETENYSFGKVSLNDYIDAVNILDNNRFNSILHDLQYKKLLIEWLRITDQLVEKNNTLLGQALDTNK